MILYRLLQAIVGLAVATLLVFFVIGLADGSIDGSNLSLWLALLAIPLVALVAAARLWRRGRGGAAWLVLIIPAFPAFCYGLFVLLVVLLQPDFR